MTPQLICIAAVCAMITELPKFDYVRSQRFSMTKSQELTLAKECEEMNSYGKISALMSDLNSKAEELAAMRIAHDPHAYQNRISELESEIRQTVKAAKAILRPEWSEMKWPYRATWNLAVRNFSDIDQQIIEYAFEMTDFELASIQLGGIEREDLYPLLKVTADKENISITLEKKASSLELCQLQSTLMITGQTTFRFNNKRFSRPTELVLRPGAIYLPEPPPPELPTLMPDFDYEDVLCRLIKKCQRLEDYWPRPKEPIPLPFPIPKPYDPTQINQRIEN